MHLLEMQKSKYIMFMRSATELDKILLPKEHSTKLNLVTFSQIPKHVKLYSGCAFIATSWQEGTIITSDKKVVSSPVSSCWLVGLSA